GCGDSEWQPWSSNSALFYELGWKTILIDNNQAYMDYASKLRPEAICICGDALKIDYAALFKSVNAPNVIDYLSVDLDMVWPCVTPNVIALSHFRFQEYDFKFLTMETDFYSEFGIYQKKALQELMKNKKYKLIFEDVGLVYNGTKYLEDWYLNPDYKDDYKIPNILDRYYYQKNPNEILLDLVGKWPL
ncbi:MAG: hypothetical protein AABY22_31985, partial [Nanoarchaeota archaeon]